MQADAEHEQDHANLRQLLGERLIGGEPGRVRAQCHPGQQIPHQWREAQSQHAISSRGGDQQTGGESEQQVGFVHSATITADTAVGHLAAPGASNPDRQTWVTTQAVAWSHLAAHVAPCDGDSPGTSGAWRPFAKHRGPDRWPARGFTLSNEVPNIDRLATLLGHARVSHPHKLLDG